MEHRAAHLRRALLLRREPLAPASRLVQGPVQPAPHLLGLGDRGGAVRAGAALDAAHVLVDGVEDGVRRVGRVGRVRELPALGGDRELRPVALEFRVVAHEAVEHDLGLLLGFLAGGQVLRLPGEGVELGDVGLGVARQRRVLLASLLRQAQQVGQRLRDGSGIGGGLPGEHAVNLGAHGAARDRDPRWTRRVAWKETRARSSGRVV